jgi:NADPH-dependent curcumin reductase CurA
MHKIHSRHLVAEDFDAEDISSQTLIDLNVLIDLYNKDKSPDLFLALKRRLPEGFLQTRYVEASYQALREMYFWRKSHRLIHWQEFCDWLTTLPNAWIITMEGK